MGWAPAFAVLSILVMLGAVLGSEPIARALTDEEKKRLGALLREHDYRRARLVALRFAKQLTHNGTAARDLMGRADVRLTRFGWDPQEVPLVQRLCRLVWSEWTNTLSESDAARAAEGAFLREMEVSEGLSTPSVERRVVHEEARRESAERARAQLAKLRASFEKSGDEVNLLWLDYAGDGETDLQQMAQRSGRNVTDFYRAADRRKRAARRLLDEERGVPYEEGA